MLYKPSIDVSLFPTFIAVVDYKTTLKASKLLHISQPTVTDHIHRLEAACRGALFHRSRQGMILTAKGEALYGYAKRMMTLLGDIEQEMSDSTEVSGRLSLAASTTIASYIVPLLIRGFVKKYPDVRVHVSALNTADTLEAVHKGTVSMGLMEGYSSSQYVHILPFIEDDLILVGSPDKQYSFSSLSEVLHHPLIWREQGSGTREVIERAFVAAGVDVSALSIPFEFGSTQAIKQGVEAGLGLAFLSRWAVAKELQQGQLATITIPNFSIKRSLYWVKPSGPLDTVHSTFYAFSTPFIHDLIATPLNNWVI